MKTFRQYLHRLFREEKYSDEQIVQAVPSDIEAALKKLPETVLTNIYSGVEKESEQSNIPLDQLWMKHFALVTAPKDIQQKILAMPGQVLFQAAMAVASIYAEKNYDIGEIWTRFQDVKNIFDVYKARSADYSMGKFNTPAAARQLGSTSQMEEQEKTKLYNLVLQKFTALFKNPYTTIPPDLLKFLNLYQGWEAALVAPNFNAVKDKGVTVKPFYRFGGQVKVAPDFASQRYKDWSEIISSVIRSQPVQVLRSLGS